MNYRKLLHACLSHTPMSRQRDSSLPIVALVAGLAIGASLSVLFAPKKGEETRGMIADGAADISDSLMRKFNDAKERLFKSETVSEVADQAIENVRKKASKVAKKLTGPEDEAKDLTKIKVPSAGTTAWKDNNDEA